jgi:hypothetical protein
MKYTNKTFSVAIGQHNMTDLLYDLRVGNITEAEYKRLIKSQDTRRREIETAEGND